MTTVLLCACGTRIVGRGYVDATNLPTSPDDPRLCLSCAADHGRERPGDLVQASADLPADAQALMDLLAQRAAERVDAARMVWQMVTGPSANDVPESQRRTP